MEIGSSSKRGSRRKGKWKPILTIVLVLIIIRLALPFALQSYFNARLDQIDGYAGQVDRVSVSVLRGAYTLHDVTVVHRELDIPSAFFQADRLHFFVQWSEVFQGNRVGAVRMQGPELHFAVSSEGESRYGVGVDWSEELSGLFPWRINQVEVHGGEAHFSDFSRELPVHVWIGNVVAEVRNLANTLELEEEMSASLRARGRPMGAGRFSMNVAFAPGNETPAFELSMAVSGLVLESLDSLLRTYGNYRIRSGLFDLFGEVSAYQGNYEGQVTTFFSDLDAQWWREPEPPLEEEHEDEPGVVWPLQQRWEAIGEPVVELRGPPESLVLRAPFSTSFEVDDIALEAAMARVLVDLFVHGLVPGLELQAEED